MGGSTYDGHSRSIRATSDGFYSKPVDQIFSKGMHESMNPANIAIRECRDSQIHPNTVPIIIALDVTGSMHHIPHDLVKDGLPTMMTKLIQSGVPDAAVLFLAVGDHVSDNSPLQVGQFESGDSELDMWLTRTYLEGGGGPNRGESYMLAWYFAANHVVMDSFEKRNQKGFLFTIGDEPNLPEISQTALKEIMGVNAKGQGTMLSEDLLELAQEKFNVFHIFVEHGNRSINSEWRKQLGQNLIVCRDHTKIPSIISNTVVENTNTLIITKESSATPEIPIEPIVGKTKLRL